VTQILLARLARTIREFAAKAERWTSENERRIVISRAKLVRSRRLLDRLYEREFAETERHRLHEEMRRHEWLIGEPTGKAGAAPAPLPWRARSSLSSAGR
jgi:hypothetical protein